MDEQHVPQQPEPDQTQECFAPRPAWQVWGARVMLVLYLLFVIYQAIHIATGGRI